MSFKSQKRLLILLGFWGNFVIIFTGIRSNCCISQPILIGSENLYSVLPTTAMVSYLPNAFSFCITSQNAE